MSGGPNWIRHVYFVIAGTHVLIRKPLAESHVNKQWRWQEEAVFKDQEALKKVTEANFTW